MYEAAPAQFLFRCWTRRVGSRSEGMQLDREIVLAAIKQNPSSLRYAAEALRADREFIMAVVLENGRVLKYVLEELRTWESISCFCFLLLSFLNSRRVWTPFLPPQSTDLLTFGVNIKTCRLLRP